MTLGEMGDGAMRSGQPPGFYQSKRRRAQGKGYPPAPSAHPLQILGGQRHSSFRDVCQTRTSRSGDTEHQGTTARFRGGRCKRHRPLGQRAQDTAGTQGIRKWLGGSTWQGTAARPGRGLNIGQRHQASCVLIGMPTARRTPRTTNGTGGVAAGVAGAGTSPNSPRMRVWSWTLAIQAPDHVGRPGMWGEEGKGAREKGWPPTPGPAPGLPLHHFVKLPADTIQGIRGSYKARRSASWKIQAQPTQQYRGAGQSAH